LEAFASGSSKVGCGLVDDSEVDATTRELTSESESGWACSDNQHRYRQVVSPDNSLRELGDCEKRSNFLDSAVIVAQHGELTPIELLLQAKVGVSADLVLDTNVFEFAPLRFDGLQAEFA
jgi:hypothetical protein